MSNIGYAIQTPRSTKSSIRPVSRTKKVKMKISFKQKFRNWLLDDSEPEQIYSNRAIEADSLSSDGMRFQLYKASGGFVIETRQYDERTDRHNTKMYVINEDKDLGEELGKIITMECMR